MVDNLNEKVDKCPLNWVYCLCTIGSMKVSIIQSSIVSASKGFKYIEVYSETVRTFRIVCYIVGVCCGC